MELFRSSTHGGCADPDFHFQSLFSKRIFHTARPDPVRSRGHLDYIFDRMPDQPGPYRLDRSHPVQYFILYIHHCWYVYPSRLAAGAFLAPEYVFYDTDIGLSEAREKTTA